LLSVLYGILSAGTWGAADFIGGLASKRTSPYRVLFLAEIAGLVPFIVIALAIRETVPPAIDMLLGAGSSLIGLSGLLLLYRALADGQMSVAAPVSALFAALIPVIFGFFSLGAPSLATLTGFGLAFLAVWLISQTDAEAWRSPLKGLRGLDGLASLRLAAGVLDGGPRSRLPAHGLADPPATPPATATEPALSADRARPRTGRSRLHGVGTPLIVHVRGMPLHARPGTPDGVGKEQYQCPDGAGPTMEEVS